MVDVLPRSNRSNTGSKKTKSTDNISLTSYFEKKSEYIAKKAAMLKSQPVEENKALKLFCDSIYETMIALPRMIQIETRKKIQDIIYEAELSANNIIYISTESVPHEPSLDEQQSPESVPHELSLDEQHSTSS